MTVLDNQEFFELCGVADECYRAAKELNLPADCMPTDKTAALEFLRGDRSPTGVAHEIINSYLAGELDQLCGQLIRSRKFLQGLMWEIQTAAASLEEAGYEGRDVISYLKRSIGADKTQTLEERLKETYIN